MIGNSAIPTNPIQSYMLQWLYHLHICSCTVQLGKNILMLVSYCVLSINDNFSPSEFLTSPMNKIVVLFNEMAQVLTKVRPQSFIGLIEGPVLHLFLDIDQTYEYVPNFEHSFT